MTIFQSFTHNFWNTLPSFMQNETWALFYLKMTKEKQFNRIRTFNLVEHKSAVSKHVKEAHFTVAPSHDSRQRDLYHYIALMKTLPAHMYRNIKDDCLVEDIEHFIQEKLSVERGESQDEETRQEEEIEETQNEHNMEVEESQIWRLY